jgi:hypothetical protein
VRSQLRVLQVALSMYEADQRRLPVGSPRLDDDDAPWLFAALLCPPALGGGVNAPYLDWRPEAIGLLQTGVGAPLVRPLAPDEWDRLRDPAFLRAHGPDDAEALVLLDPWGHPFHGRSWAKLRAAEHERLLHAPWLRGPFDALPARDGAQPPVAHLVEDRPHAAHGWDLWSAGPNGVNEYGAACSDDVTTWTAHDEPSCTCSFAWAFTRRRWAGAGVLALTGGLFAAGGLGLLVRARARRPTRKSQGPSIGLRARTSAARCAFCHASDRRTPLLACTACGAGLHLDCWHDAGACPTLGCA